LNEFELAFAAWLHRIPNRVARVEQFCLSVGTSFPSGFEFRVTDVTLRGNV
jgi:hypothetical protein